MFAPFADPLAPAKGRLLVNCSWSKHDENAPLTGRPWRPGLKQSAGDLLFVSNTAHTTLGKWC